MWRNLLWLAVLAVFAILIGLVLRELVYGVLDAIDPVAP